jgi:hypothetical protein
VARAFFSQKAYTDVTLVMIGPLLPIFSKDGGELFVGSFRSSFRDWALQKNNAWKGIATRRRRVKKGVKKKPLRHLTSTHL